MSDVWLSLTGYGISNLEALLILSVIATIVGIGYWHMGRVRHIEAHRLESELTKLQGQLEQLQKEVLAVQQQNERSQAQLVEASRHREEIRNELVVAQGQCRQLQLELDEAQRQRDLDKTQHQNKLDEVRALNDPHRINEMQNNFRREIAHSFRDGLSFVASQCRDARHELLDDQRDLGDILRHAETRALQMRQHALDVLWLESFERQTRTWELVSPREVLERVVRDQYPHAQARNVRLFFQPRSLGSVLTDRQALYRVLNAVIDNAIKYSHDQGGSVKISSFSLEDETGKWLVVDVQDDGIGMRAEIHESIFELTQRGEGLVDGAGLGLPTARREIRLLGGDLHLLESTPHAGSTFRITLPFREGDDPSLPVSASEGEAS